MEKVTPPTAITVDKEVRFNNKRFSYEDLKRIAFLIKKAVVKFKEPHLNITFSLPDSLQRADSFEIFKDVDFFSQQRIRALTIHCREWAGNTLISVDIRHGVHVLFSIAGEKNWVASTEAAIHELLESVPPACPRWLKHRVVWFIFPCMAGVLFFFLANFAVGYFYHWTTGDSNFLNNLGKFLGQVYIATLLITAIIFSVKLIRLWPDVEIDTGPEYLKSEKIWRQRIGKGILILSIALSTILSVIALLGD